MIDKLFGNVKVVAAIWASFLAYGLYLFNSGPFPKIVEMAKGMDLPETIVGASYDYQTVFLDEIGENGVALYSSFQMLDLLNALLFGLVLSSTIYLVFKRIEAARPFFALAAIPILTAALDLAENGVMLLNVRNLPRLDPSLSSVFTYLTIAKLTLGTVSIFILLTCIVALAVTVIGKRFKK